MKTKKVGIIGCGNIAQVHSLIINEMDDAVLSVLCDKDEDKITKFSKESFIETYTDWQKLCDLDLDVVHICTPHFLHVPMAVKLLKSGKAVLMEKPCAISRKQFDELKKTDALYPGKLGICLQNRYNNSTRLLDRLIFEEGKIGTVTGGRAFVTWRRDEWYYSSSDWKGKFETEGGGALINQSIHTLDLLLRYLGNPDKVEATTANHHLKGLIEVEDTVEAWMSFPDGKRACFYCSNGYVADAPILLEIQGEKGRILINGSSVTLETEEKTEHFDAGKSKGLVKDYWGEGHKACIKDFYRCLDKGISSPIDLKSVENTFETMMRIYECQ